MANESLNDVRQLEAVIASSPLASEILSLMIASDMVDSGKVVDRTLDGFTRTGRRKDVVIIPTGMDNLTGDC
ncbi:MAG: hypothetical protein WAS36_00015 [Candidatus Saccharimonadales bacterium]